MTQMIQSGGGGALRAWVFARAHAGAHRKGLATDRPSVSGTDVIIFLSCDRRPGRVARAELTLQTGNITL